MPAVPQVHDDDFAGLMPATAGVSDSDFAGIQGISQDLTTPTAPEELPAIHRGMSDDEILTALGQDPTLVKKSKFYKEGQFGDLIDEYGNAQTGVTEGGSFRYGTESTGGGLAQFLLRRLNYATEKRPEGIVGSELAHRNALEAMKNYAYKSASQAINPETGKVDTASFGGELAGSMVIPGVGVVGKVAGKFLPKAAAAAEKVPGFIRAGVSDFISGAAAPQAAAPTPGSEEDSGMQELISGGVGVAGGATTRGTLTALVKGGNAVAGRLDPRVRTDVLNQAKAHGIDVRVGDVLPTRAGRGLENFSENVPATGAATMTEKTLEQSRLAADKIQAKSHVDMIATLDRLNNDPTDLATLRAAALKTDDTGKAAKAILAELEDPATQEDWSKIVKASGRFAAFKKKLEGDVLYDKARALGTSLPHVQLNTFLPALTSAIEAEGKKPTSDRAFINLLKDWATTSQGGALPTGNKSYDVSFNTLAEFKKEMQTYLTKAEAAQGGLNPTQAREIKALREALLTDMKGAAKKANNGAYVALAHADDFHSSEVVPAYESGLAKAIDKDTPPDELRDQFMKTGLNTYHRGNRFYESLDERGRSAVLYSIAKDAYTDSTKDGKFNPTAYFKFVRDRTESHNVFLKGGDQHQIRGFANVMGALDRLGHDDTVNMQKNIQRIASAGTGLVASGALVAAAGGSPGTLTGLAGLWLSATVGHFGRNSASARKFWLAASDLPPNSPQLVKLTEEFTREIAAQTGARQATKVTNPKGVEP